LRERSVQVRTALFFAALVAISYWPVFLGGVPLPTDQITQFPPFRAYYELSDRTPHAELGDTVTEIYPWRKFAGETIRRGVIPLWNPYLLAGMPFQADPLSALFYPLNWIFVFLPIPVAWSLSLMLKVFLAAIFTFLLLREIGASVSGAILAATAFAFGGFVTAWLAWPRMDSLLWLPLLLFQIHRLCRQPCKRHAIILAAISAMPILAGHPGMIARVLAAAAGYGIWIVLVERSRSYRQQLAWLIVAGCLAVGLASVQLVPTAEWLTLIFRTLDMPAFSLPFSQAIGFFSRDMSRQPNSAGVFIPEGAVYLGAFCLLAATFAFQRRGKKDTTFFAILFAINFCIAYGVSPIAELSQMLPVFRGLRMDEALMVAGFSLAVLAGLGISYLESFDWKSSTKTNTVGTVGILLVATAACHEGAAVLSKMTRPGVEWWRSPRSFRVLLILSAFVIALRLLQVLTRRQWLALVSLLIAVDLVSYGYAHMPFNRVETIYPKVPLFDFLSQREKPFRVAPLDSVTPGNVEYLYGVSTAGGYEYMARRTTMLTESLLLHPANGYSVAFGSRAVVQANHRILDLLNVRYLIATPYNASESLLRTAPNRFRQVWSDGMASVFENLTVLPRALLVPQSNIEVIPSEEAQLARLRDSSFDPQLHVILPSRFEAVDVEEKAVSEPPGGVKYSEGLNWVRVEVTASTPSVLVLSQMHYPGWKAYVDGKRAPLLRPNYAFTGTPVNPGKHDVEFRFIPISLIVGAIVSIASLLLAVVGYSKARSDSSI
jgi:hypothetical protein